MRAIFLIGLTCCALMPISGMSEERPWEKPVYLDASAQESEKIEISPVTWGDLRENILSIAIVSKNLITSVPVRPAGNGKTIGVFVLPGQIVTQGQVLATYNDYSLQNIQLEHRQVHSEISSAKASLLAAGQAYRRGVLLKGTGISFAELQQRFAAKQQAKATLVAYQTQHAAIEYRLKNEFMSATETYGDSNVSRLISPVNGVVEHIRSSIGSDIKSGDDIAIVTDYSKLWIVAQIKPDDANELKIGGQMKVRPAGKDNIAPVRVKITTIDRAVDPETGLLKVIGIIDNSHGTFYPGEMLDVSLEKEAIHSGIIVPLEAIQDINDHKIVYVKNDSNKFSPCEIEIIAHDEKRAVVSGHLNSSNNIVTRGSFILKSVSLISSEGGN